MRHAREDEATIYALIDPRTGALRYVGVTGVSLSRRLWRHIDDAKRGCETHRSRWIRTILADGARPEIVAIESGVARDREVFWIAHHRAAGNDLTNLTDGGGGTAGFRMPPDVVARIVERNTGRVPSQQTRSAIAASLAGKRLAPETRAKLSAVRAGRSKSAETRAKMSAAWKGIPKSAEHRAKLSEVRRKVAAAKREALFPPAARELAMGMHRAGCSCRSIAKATGVGATFVSRFLKENGHAPRAN